MSTWAERKAERRERFERFVKGWRLARCIACNGSGIDDHNGSPPCGSCGGTGRQRLAPEDWKRRAQIEQRERRDHENP